jgi:hypothetical protein
MSQPLLRSQTLPYRQPRPKASSCAADACRCTQFSVHLARAREIGSGQAKVSSARVLEGHSPVVVPRGDVRAVGDQQRHHIVLPRSGGKMQRG